MAKKPITDDVVDEKWEPAPDHPSSGSPGRLAARDLMVEKAITDEPFVTDQPKPKKPANTGDPELKAMARVVRMLAALPPEAQQRVGCYLASRYERKVQ